jgi:hypothetical protein
MARLCQPKALSTKQTIASAADGEVHKKMDLHTAKDTDDARKPLKT